MRDFVVVGAGPAGSRFARQAASEGRDVVVFERGRVGEPLACSGHVSLDLWSFTPDGAREQLLQNEVYGARFHTGGADSDGYRYVSDGPISNVIDRVELDRLLADAAINAGATLREQHTVTGVREFEDRVEVDVRHNETERTVEARMVVGCDGPASRVRKELGLPEPEEILHGVLAFDPTPDPSDFVDVHLTVPRFFAWRIPRGDAGVEYGLAAPPDAAVGEHFDALIDDYDVNVVDRCAGGIPIQPPTETTTRRGLLIGDAAGQTKPFTGGGILYGMTAADLAASHVDPMQPDTVALYDRAWRDELGRDIALGRWIRRAYSLPTPVQRLGLRATAGAIGVHMDRPTTLFSREHMRAALSRSTSK